MSRDLFAKKSQFPGATALHEQGQSYMYKQIAIGLTAFFCAGVSAATLEEKLQACRANEASSARLSCFDSLADEAVDAAMAPSEAEACIDCGETPVAAEISAESQLMVEIREKREREANYLSTNHPNFFGVAVPVEDKLQDESHAEFYLSLKYPLYSNSDEYRHEPFETRVGPRWPTKKPDRLYFVYNGLYDFYVTGERYESSPVISRQQNVGLQTEWHSADRREKIRVGWMHESNGQVLGEEDAAIYYENRALFGDDFALADVSRGWDYILFRYERGSHEFPSTRSKSWWRYHFELRGYFCDCQGIGFSDIEDQIWWEPGNDSSISDYDGLRFMYERKLWGTENGFDFNVRTELKAGIHDPTNLGGKLTLEIVKRSVRVSAFYFNGYGKEPSTYHLRTKYLGVGLELR